MELLYWGDGCAVQAVVGLLEQPQQQLQQTCLGQDRAVRAWLCTASIAPGCVNGPVRAAGLQQTAAVPLCQMDHVSTHMRSGAGLLCLGSLARLALRARGSLALLTARLGLSRAATSLLTRVLLLVLLLRASCA